MPTRYINSRSLATASGAVATAAAIGLLVADAVHSGTWTAEHAFVPVVVLLTVAGGHLATAALRERRPIAAIGFALVFLLGTAVTVTNGIGRLSEGSETKAATALSANAAIDAKKAEIADARQRLATAHANAEREMRGSCGPRCRDWRQRADEVASHLAILEVQLSKLGGHRPVHVKAEKVGQLAALLGLDGQRVRDGFGLIEPLLLPLLLELAAIAGLGFGLGHRAEAPSSAPAQAPAEVAEPSPPPGKRSRRGATARDPNVVSFVERFRATHGRSPSLRDMRAAFPDMPQSTAQRYRASGVAAARPMLRVAAG